MAVNVKRRHDLFSRDHEHGLRTGLSVTPNGERDAWAPNTEELHHDDSRTRGSGCLHKGSERLRFSGVSPEDALAINAGLKRKAKASRRSTPNTHFTYET